VFEEMRQKHSRRGNQWENISIVKIIQLKLWDTEECRLKLARKSFVGLEEK